MYPPYLTLQEGDLSVSTVAHFCFSIEDHIKIIDMVASNNEEGNDTFRSSDLCNMNELSSEQLDKFIDLIVKFLRSSEGVNLAQNMKSFANMYQINQRVLKKLARATIEFMQKALGGSLSKEQFKLQCDSSGLNATTTETLVKYYSENALPISQSLVGKVLHVNRLVNMEWKFGVTSGSDDISQIGNTFLQLKLILDKGYSKYETEYLELLLPQFYQFLANMEAVKSQLDYLSSKT